MLKRALTLYHKKVLFLIYYKMQFKNVIKYIKTIFYNISLIYFKIITKYNLIILYIKFKLY